MIHFTGHSLVQVGLLLTATTIGTCIPTSGLNIQVFQPHLDFCKWSSPFTTKSRHQNYGGDTGTCRLFAHLRGSPTSFLPQQSSPQSSQNNANTSRNSEHQPPETSKLEAAPPQPRDGIYRHPSDNMTRGP
ncbi:hypothetical protein V2W45_583212 [Cenococcum geophilum]